MTLIDTPPATRQPRSRAATALIVALIAAATLAFGVLGAVLSTGSGGGVPRTPPTTLSR